MTEVTAEEFWAGKCRDCAHPEHRLGACGEIVGGYTEPEYCPCATELQAMDSHITALESSLAEMYDLWWAVAGTRVWMGVPDASERATRAYHLVKDSMRWRELQGSFLEKQRAS